MLNLIFLLGLVSGLNFLPLYSIDKSNPYVPNQKFATTDELKRGDTLLGKTRMGGNVMVDFTLTILSISKHAAPETDSILAVIEDELFEETGVLAGMSGSPVYYEDKIVGAVAYTVSFLKKPIVGITPITAMFPIIDYEKHPNTQRERETSPTFKPLESFSPSYLPLFPYDPLSFVKNSNKDVSTPSFSKFKPTPSLKYPKTLRPIAMPLAIEGEFYLDEKLINEWSGMENFVLAPSKNLSPATIRPNSLNTQNLQKSKQLQEHSSEPLQEESPHTFAQLVPGDLVGVNLVRGSLNISSFGTVTYNDGTYLLAFGHPMNLLGTTDLSFYTGFVDAVVPRLDFSYKVGRLLTEVGAIRQDRSPGILAVKGEQTPRLPIEVTLKTPVTEQKLHFEVIKTRPFIERFTSLVLLNSFLQFEGLGGNTTFQYALNIENMQGERVEIERTLLYGAVQQNLFALSGYFNALLTRVQDNAFKPVSLKTIHLTLETLPNQTFSFLEQIHYSKQSFRPGAVVPFTVTFKNFKGETFTQNFNYTLPQTLQAGKYVINLANEVDFMAEDLRANPERYAPHNLDTLFKLLSLSPNENTLVIWLAAPHYTSVKLKQQHVYPNLPSIKQKLLVKLPQTGTVLLREFPKQMESLEKPVLGSLSFPINIE